MPSRSTTGRASAPPAAHCRTRRRAALLAFTFLFPQLPASAQAQSDTTALAQLQAHVRSASPALASTRAAVAVAIARREATGWLAPATISAESEEVPSAINLLQAGSVRFDLSREFLPQTGLAAQRALADKDIDRARLGVEIAEHASDATVQQLVARASGAAAIATRLSSEDSLLIGTEEAVRSRFSVGDARYVDVLRLRTERLHVTTELQRTRSEQRIARLQLLRLAEPAVGSAEGRGDAVRLVDAAIGVETRQLISGVLPPAPALDSLLASSAVLRLAALAVERAEAGRRLARAEQRPTFTGSLGIQRFSADDGGHSIGPTIGLTMTLPFTARRGNAARDMVATQQIALATAEQRARIATTHAALAAAIDRYETSRTALISHDVALLRGAREEREAALSGFRSGTLTLLELLDFERALAQAEISRIRSRIDAADALVDLYMIALGEGSGAGHSTLSAPDRPETER